ncbi:Hypothetical predicted protein [Paramuricea clavata]|uniref:Uncharacterized protein n=1 Tax=Paramuricea clavata TaxID=317549 RepID=A0A7D9L416_PARCT|nr:Hypothetical predicted protein [Paramuricea clavata]
MKLESVEDCTDKFIRCYSLDEDSPKVILFTNDQVDDIVNFCCNDVDGHKSLLYVDITFQLGPFFVMRLTYKNTTLYTKRDPATCPLMVGPMMLGMLKDKSTYLTLFQKLTAQVPGLKLYLQGYSSDSESALRQALAQEFEKSLSFLCKLHAQKNIEEKCRKLRFSKSLTDIIINDIFGSGGLVMADSVEDYRDHLDALTSKWDYLEFKDTKKTPSFSTYFRQYKSSDILNHVSAKASRAAGFGDSVQTNNVPESANALLKRWQGFSSKDMSTFIDDVKELIDKQKSDVRRAFLGLESPYVVRPEYQRYEKSPSEFFEDSPVAHIQRTNDGVHKTDGAGNNGPKRVLILDDEDELENVDVHPGSSTNSHSLCFVDEDSADPSTSRSACSSEFCDLRTICSKELGSMFSAKDLNALSSKAEQLIEDNSIRKGFESQSFLVRSSLSCTPHYVKHLASGKYICDKACIGFNTRKICSHKRKTSPDPVSSMNRNETNQQPGPKPGTVGELFHYQAEPSNDPLKITIRRSRPDKPAVAPIMSTPFQLIDITGRIRKCAGCRKDLKEGPDDFSRHDMDKKLCIRHKEHDFVFITSYHHWKKTFENKHYHVFLNCVKGRNPAFDSCSVQIALNHTLSGDEIAFLKERMEA